MSWWTSVVDGAKFVYKGLGTVSSGIGSGLKWLWNKAPLTKTAETLFTYGANTFFQGMAQIMALQKAVPALMRHPATRQIVDEVVYIVKYDVAPLYALNVVNNVVQSHFREGHPEDSPWLAPYALFLSGLTVLDYGVRAYTWRQGAKASVHMMVTAIYGPPAFNSNKKATASFCDDLKCSETRKLKGVGREQVILIANDLLVLVISSIPGIGEQAAWFVRVICNGRYITRVVTPERCEDHKAMMQESVLALGLSYELSCVLMDVLLEHTVGLPPFLYHRILKQVLLLLHINTATYMDIPLINPEEATIRLDFVNRFEWITRFIANVIYAGLAKRIPKDFKPPKDSPPLIPLSPALQLGKDILRSDLDKEELPPNKEPVLALVGSPDLNVQSVKEQISEAEQNMAGKKPEELLFSSHQFYELLRGWVDTATPWVLPPMLQDAMEFVNDPIVKEHWPAIRAGGIATIDAVKIYGQNRAITTLVWVTDGVATVLHAAIGVPKFVTRVSLMLANEKDFWEMVDALKAWFERHDIKVEITLADKSEVLLLNEPKKIRIPDEMKDSSPVLPIEGLIGKQPTFFSALPIGKSPSTGNQYTTDSPESLLPTSETRIIEEPPKDLLPIDKGFVTSTPEDWLPTPTKKNAKNEQKTPLDDSSPAFNPESLFVIRQRNTRGVTISNVVQLEQKTASATYF